MKICKKCKNNLPNDSFYKSKTSKDHLTHNCKQCSNIINKDWVKNNHNRKKEILKKCIEKRNLEGKCIKCSDLKMPNHNFLCEKHWYIDKARKTVGSSEWTNLKQLAENQNFKCVYTGFTLIPGDNMSIDHIFPTAKGGSNKLENLQWVDLKINYMKRDMTHEEFLNTCNLITQISKK